MRAVISILLFFFLFGNLAGQSPLDERVTISVQNTLLTDALFEISDQADVNITFNNNLVKGYRTSFRAVEERLGDLLPRILEDFQLTIDLAGSVIVVVPLPPKQKFTISGYLTDAETGEPLIGANVYLSGEMRGTSTNAYGFYSLTLEEGPLKMVSSYLGYRSKELEVDLRRNLRRNVELERNLTLSEVVVTASAREMEPGIGTISKYDFQVEELDRLPALGGEVDVLRSSYLVPGVQTGADGFGGISVRGGNVDQNLFLLDGVPVYNATHLLGVYSVFNSSAVHSATMYTGVVPARFGGRASSVLDVRTKEGNLKEPKLEVDAGLTSGKFTLEGPLQGEKSSYIITGRRSFIDLYSRPISRYLREANDVDGELGYYFFDFNGKVNVSVGDRDRFFLSFYTGGDNYQNDERVVGVVDDTTRFENAEQVLNWGNTIASFRWNHLFGNRLFLNTTITYSRFFYKSREVLDFGSLLNDVPISRDYLSYRYESNNQDLAAKLDFDFAPNPEHYFRFGVNFTRHRFQPGAVVFDERVEEDTTSLETLGFLLERNPLFSNEMDAYVEDEMRIGDRLWLNIGFRFNTLFVEEHNYSSLQPRMQMRYSLGGGLDLRASGGKATQTLHLLSNSGIGLPRDLWVSSTKRISPVQSWQYTLGLGWGNNKGWSALVEGYYKTMENLIDFQEGVLANIDGTNWQNEVIIGSGRSYGVEFMLEKKTGSLTGWLSYTLGFSNRTFPDDNFGLTYPYKLDRRHNLGIALQYSFNSKWSIGANFAIRSGENTTLPRASYLYNQLNLLYGDFPPQFPFLLPAFNNGEKNTVKLATYHRLDLNLRYHLERPRSSHTFNLGVYNAYLQRNPWYYSLVRRTDDNGDPELQYVQFSFLPFLPSLRYRWEFFSNRGVE